MHALSGRQANDLLPVLAQKDAVARELGVRAQQADDAPPERVALEAKEKVGRREVVKVKRVRLEDLAVVHEPPDALGGRWGGAHAHDPVHRLRGGEVVADGADPAEALHEDRHLPVGPALDEALEAPKLDDVQAHLLNPVVVVEEDGHLAVTLDTRHWLDDDAPERLGMGGRIEVAGHSSGRSSVEVNEPGSRVGRPARDELDEKLPIASAEGGQPGRK